MSDTSFSRLTEYLGRWRQRMLISELVVWLPRAVLLGLVAGLVLAGLARTTPLLDNTQLVKLAALLVMVTAVAALLIIARPRTLSQLARIADRKLKLKERTTAAVEIDAGTLVTLPEMMRLQLADALYAAEQVNVQSALPFRARTRDLFLLLATAALFLLSLVLPNPQLERLRERRELAEVIQEQVAALEEAREEIENDGALTDLQRAELLQPILGAIDQLDQSNLTREQAVAVLSEAAADLKELGANSQSEELSRALNAAGESLSTNPAAEALGSALQNGNMAQASAAAFDLADALDELDAESQQRLAAALEQSAARMSEVDPELSEALANAAEALRNGDLAAAQQAMRDAAAALRERSQEQATGAAAGELAEQLEQSRDAVAGAGGGQEGGDESAPGLGTQAATGDGAGDQGNGTTAGGLEGEGAGAGGISRGPGHATTVYVPDAVDLSGEEGQDIELPAGCVLNPDNCGALISENPAEFGDESSLVPYDRVFGNYRSAAIQALDSSYIPLGLKDYVREYFSSLEP